MKTPFYGLLALIPASFALAETPLRLDSQTVTADFRQTDVQQLPEAVSVIDDAQLKARSAEHLEQVISFAPNVNISTTASRGRYLQIRGIGETSQFIDPVNPAVGLIIDGIDMTGLGAAATLFDIQQVEILRGPQGTRFGANSLAGMINIQSQRPTQTPKGYVRGKIGNYDSLGLGAAVSGALGDHVQGRIAVHGFRSDGYMENDHLNRDDTMAIQERLVRGTLHWQPDAQSELRLTYLFADIDNGYDAFTLDNSRHSLADEPGKDAQRTHALSLRYQTALNSALSLETSLTGSHSDLQYSFDEDWTYDGIHIDGYRSTDEYLRTHKRASADIRLLSGGTGRLFNDSTDWVIGFYHMQRDEQLNRHYTYRPQPYRNHLETLSHSVYGELSTAFSPFTRLIYGLRMERWENEFSANDGIVEHTQDNLFGGKITLEHQIMPEHLGYVSLARGYKAGGINSSPDIAAQYRVFKPEYNHSLELGLKSNWLNEQWTTRLALFYVERDDQQVFSSYPINNPGGGTNFQDYFANAAKGRNAGIELESHWQLNEHWLWEFSYGYLHSEFVNYRYTNSQNVVMDKTGRAQAYAPKHSGSSALTYAFLNHWSLRLETEAKDRFYFSDSHDAMAKGYVLWHARLAYQTPRYELALNARNLGNIDVHTHGFAGFGNDPRNNYAESQYVQLGEPRLIMLEGQYSF